MKKNAGDKPFITITNRNIYDEVLELKEIVKGYPWIKRGMYLLYTVVFSIVMKLMFFM